MIWPIVVTMIVGSAAGCLGALLGLGGGIFLLPVLNLVIGLPFYSAASISVVAVVATSTAVSLSGPNRALANVRLAMLLQVLTLLGATTGAFMLQVLSERGAQRLFAATAAVMAVVMLQRRHRRNVIAGANVDVGVLGGRLIDSEMGAEVYYQVRQLPLAAAVSYVAGILASLFGVGGGLLIVPVLNLWCGVPIRVAAATSAIMIGVTAVPGFIGHYRLGHLTAPPLAAAGVLGVLAGSRAGAWLSARARVLELKLLMSVILTAVAIWYFIK